MPQNITEKINPAWVAVTAPAQGDFIDPDAMAEDLSKLAERDAWLRLLIKNVCDQQGVVLSDTETTGLLSALDARYFKNSQLDNQATDAEVAAAIVAHLAAADPHPQYVTDTEAKSIAWGEGQTSAPWSRQSSFLSSKVANGWQKLEGGLIIQWGTAGFAGSNSPAVQTTVAFPIAFPNACVHISGVQTSRASNEGGGTWAMRPTNKTLTNFLATLDNNGGSSLYNFTLAQTAEWIAIGY